MIVRPAERNAAPSGGSTHDNPHSRHTRGDRRLRRGAHDRDAGARRRRQDRVSGELRPGRALYDRRPRRQQAIPRALWRRRRRSRPPRRASRCRAARCSRWCSTPPSSTPQGNPEKDANGRFIKNNIIAYTVMEKRAGWGTEYPDERPQRRVGVPGVHAPTRRPTQRQSHRLLQLPQAARQAGLRVHLRQAQGSREVASGVRRTADRASGGR